MHTAHFVTHWYPNIASKRDSPKSFEFEFEMGGTRPSQFMSSRSVSLHTLFLDRLRPLSG